MVAITVALDSRLAELGAQRFGRALADVRRAAERTRAEVDALNAGAAGLGNTLTQLPVNSRQAEVAFSRASRASMAMGQPVILGDDDAVRGAETIGRARLAIASGRTRFDGPGRIIWVQNTDLDTATIDLPLDQYRVGGGGPGSGGGRTGQAYREYFSGIVNRYRRIVEREVGGTTVDRLFDEYKDRWVAASEEIDRFTNIIRNARGSDDPRPILRNAFVGIGQLRDEQFGEDFFQSHIPNDDELRNRFASETHQYFNQLVEEQLRDAYRNTFDQPPPGDLLDPDTWIYGAPRSDSGRLSPSDQPDLFQHQRAGGIAAEADDLQRLVDARREDQIHLKRLEESRQAVAAAGAGEIAVIDDQAMALESVAMVNAGGAVSAQANADATLLLTEAYRAQSETVDGSFTPATKGAAEATMELADAAVGLDAALKSPDPMAVAEDMEELSALGQQVGNSFASAFERAVFSGEELSDVLSALALDLARLVLQQQVLGPLAGGVGSIFDAVFGAILGTAGGSVGGVTQGASTSRHTGGLVEHGAPLTRAIAPSVWLGASRYHFGGLAGDEVPAILRRGEEVLTRDDPRHRANGGLGGGVAIHQTISIDARAVNENGVDGAAADSVGRQMRAAVRSAVQAEIAQQSRVGGMLNRV